MARPPKPRPKPKKLGERSPMVLATAGVGVLSIVAWLGFSVPWLCVFVIGGFLPAIAAFLSDPARQKFDAVAVGTLSAGAMLPFVLDGLANAGRTGGREILTNPYAWISVYAAAAFAYALCWLFPMVVNVMYENRAQARIRMLERRKAQLETEWGEAVRGDPNKLPH
jgi:hypothetical protein